MPADKRSPLHDIHVGLGAQFTSFAGWQMPTRYSSDRDEHFAVRTAAGLFDLSHMGEIIVLGPEAGQALDYTFASTLSTIEVGRAQYTLLLGRDGGVLDDVIVYRTGSDRYMVVANAANSNIVAQELRERTALFDTEIFDESNDIALIAIQGPAAESILTETERFSVDNGARDGEDFPEHVRTLRYYRSMRAHFRDTSVLIARTGYTGEDGFELFIAPEMAAELWETVSEAGARHGLIPAGLASRDTLRLEAGMPLYGHELTASTFPSQAGLGRVVHVSKPGDFVGREAVENGPPMGAYVLVGLVGAGKQAARTGYNVFSDTTSVDIIGTVTSGALSPTVNVPIAMAFVDPAFAAPGTEVSIDIRGKRIPFSITELPFYKRKK